MKSAICAPRRPITSETTNFFHAEELPRSRHRNCPDAGKILIDRIVPSVGHRLQSDEVDLVTQADKRSERFIVERSPNYFHKAAIAAEEGTGHESARLRNISGT